jgi:hypothetical protein
MKSKVHLLTVLAISLLSAYSIHSTIRIYQLERQLVRLQQERRARPTLEQALRVYDEEFLPYFGENGAVAHARGVAMARQMGLTNLAGRIIIESPAPDLSKWWTADGAIISQ